MKIVFAGLMVVAFSASATPLQNALKTCRTISAEASRLTCYDALATLEEQNAISSNTKEHQKPIQSSLNSEDTFGLEHKAKIHKEDEKIASVLTSVQKSAHGHLILTFENGQVWRQTSKEIFLTSIGDTYTFERGALNAIYLSSEHSNRKTRVRREK